MSHHSDDANLQPDSDSFWEPGNYKKTTKRTEDGSKLCTDLITLVRERAEIEQMYAKNLRQWSKKFLDLIEKGPEYGTTESACKAILIEAEKRCDLNLSIRDDLCDKVIPEIKKWQKDNYHKTMMQLKEKKDFDDAFKKAQKPWAKLLTKVNKLKIDYHNACKNERSFANQERNASGDTSLSPDQLKKLQDRVSKAKEEVTRTKDKYESALSELNEYNPKYMEDMRTVFDKCQEFERKRLKFFKETLFSIHGCLNISNRPELVRIYEEYRHTIQNADAQKDLKYWSNAHGVDMAMNWPTFEEYNHEMAPLSKKDKKFNLGNGLSDNGVILQRVEGGDYYPQTAYDMDDKRIHSNNGSANKMHGSDDEQEWDEYNDALVDNGEPGVPVRALYDYEGAESDELSFKQGDVFEKLEDEDEQGWCKGRINGRVGLYPANYIEVVSSN